MISISISRFSSLNFEDGWRLGFQTDAVYEQRFRTGDRIHVQYSVPKNPSFAVFPRLVDNETGEESSLTATAVTTGEEADVFDVVFTAAVGCYTFQIVQATTPEHIAAESRFRVEESLSDTVWVECSNRRNEFDTVFSGGPFGFRMEGVFLPSERTFDVDNETFRDQRYTLTQLSALPYSKRTLTVGGGFGVPYWVAEKLNLLLSATDVSIDGASYVRSEGAAPELTQIHSDYPMFIYKIEVERRGSDYSVESGIFEAVPIVTSEGDAVTDSAGDTIMGVF